MNIIIFGPQASGKGTQSKHIAQRYLLHHLSTGDAFRAEIKKGTELGKWLDHQINTLGALVPDEKTNEVILANASYFETGIILDGYPRNIAQYEFLKSHFKIDAALEITLPESEVISRMSSRRVCPQCNTGYNVITLPPQKEGICDKCGTLIIQRKDDTPEALKNRLAIYHTQTVPITTKYAQDGILHTVDGNRPIPEVTAEIFRILDRIKDKA